VAAILVLSLAANVYGIYQNKEQALKLFQALKIIEESNALLSATASEIADSTFVP
jgi:nucleoside recognition membrane protein YjiH